ncbi:MAG TPA: hypothetical protein ENK57_04370 [Polyangiaceae bacterium]|nr:hypothetical protein [Polyangiaceae bacterium]
MSISTPSLNTVYPHLNVPIVAGADAVYCASFKAAYDTLVQALGGPVRLAHSPPLVSELERSDVSAADVDPASLVAAAGEGPDFLGELTRELESRFGERDDFLLPESLSRDDLLAYAYLSKDLTFATPFDADLTHGLHFEGTPVSCFGIWEDDDERTARRRQVRICHDGAPDDFVLELVTDGADDRLIIARMTPEATLLDTVRKAFDHVGAKPSLLSSAFGRQELRKDDVVKIPMVTIDRTRVFDELEGPLLGHDRVIAKALMRVRMQLDEKGAILRSAGMIMVPRGGRGPRMFLCNGPFLIAMVREGRALPYFAAWLATPELLEPIAPP